MIHNLELTKLKKKYDKFHSINLKILKEYPSIVVFLMHEFSRNIYPNDPYINFKIKNHFIRINKELDNLINLGKFFLNKKFYDNKKILKKQNLKHKNLEEKTGSLYSSLWKKFDINNIDKDAEKIFSKRYFNSFLTKKDFHNKSILDVGCGSGRYTFAMNKFETKEVIGVDGSAHCVEVANRLKKQLKKRKVKFYKCSNLELNKFFKTKKFDIVLSNGVIHHTSNFKKSLDELIKITKKNGKILIYIYGAGGLFWYARKQMRKIFKFIPKDFTINCLENLGMPSDRFIFVDNWYVPIEKHTTKEEFEKILRKYNLKAFKRILTSKIVTDLDVAVKKNKKYGKLIWGNWELRYLLVK